MREFKINEYITLKMDEDGKTNIFIRDKLFKQCKFLLLNIPVEETNNADEISSIDEAEEYLDKTLEINKKEGLSILPETEFFAHCSNLQVWAELGYNTDLLHRNLAFPLLKVLSKEGDQTATQKFKEEIARRYKYGNYTVQAFLFEEGYLKLLSFEEILSGILEPEDADFMANFVHLSERYSLIPVLDLLRDLPRDNKFFFSVKNGRIMELELILDNKINKIPSSMENLTGLYDLRIIITAESELFGESFSLQSVRNLNIFCHSYARIPDLLFYFPNVRDLYITGNHLIQPSIELEKSLSMLNNLENLKLSFLNLLIIPDSIKNLKKLKVLSLHNLPLKSLPIAIIKDLLLEDLILVGNDNLQISEVVINNLKKRIRVTYR